jgi:hypothetical protein
MGTKRKQPRAVEKDDVPEDRGRESRLASQYMHTWSGEEDTIEQEEDTVEQEEEDAVEQEEEDAVEQEEEDAVEQEEEDAVEQGQEEDPIK